LLKTIKQNSTPESTNKNKTIPGGYIMDKLCEIDDEFFTEHPIKLDQSNPKAGTNCLYMQSDQETEVKEMCLSDSMKNVENGTCSVEKLDGAVAGWGSKVQGWVNEHCADMDNQVGHDQCAMYAVQNVQNAVTHCRESNITSNTCTTLVTEYDIMETDYDKAKNPCKDLEGKDLTKCKKNKTTNLEMTGGKDAWLAMKAQTNLYGTLGAQSKITPLDFSPPSFASCHIETTVGKQSGGNIDSGCQIELAMNPSPTPTPAPADGDGEGAPISSTDSLGVNTSATGNGEGSSGVTVNKDGEELSSGAAIGGAKTGTDTTADSEWNLTTLALLCCVYFIYMVVVCGLVGLALFMMNQQ
jgi:hypothetical protein